MQDAVNHLAFPHCIKLDLRVQPLLQPGRVGQARLNGVVRVQRCVDMQIGGMQGLRGAPGAGHQNADFGKGAFCLQPKGVDRPLHVAQIGTAVPGFVLAELDVDLLDDRLGVPFAGAAVPVVQPNFTAKMQHQGLQRRGRIKFKAHCVQFGFGGNQVGPEALQVFHQHQRMLLLLEKPDRHKRRKITVMPVVAQKHFGCRQRRPFGNRIHFDGLRLLFGQLAGIKGGPGDVFFHVPANRLQLLEQFGIQHGGTPKNNKTNRTKG